MKKKPTVFLSYSRQDQARATALEAALKDRCLHVWRDIRSISAGARWSQAIEAGIRSSRGVVVLITPASATSEWVTYEYAFATGAKIPVVAVTTRGARVPSPIQQFQIVAYGEAGSVAKRIDAGLSDQSRAAGQERATSPTLVAKFREVNGEPAVASDGKTPCLWIDLWLEQVPRQTKSVSFEIPDEGFRDRKWTVRRGRRGTGVHREFLTDDMNSYGDIELWARGIGRGPGNWSASWRLYEALIRYYRSRPIGPGIRTALKQIRKN
jgi:hypothetical protein